MAGEVLEEFAMSIWVEQSAVFFLECCCLVGGKAKMIRVFGFDVLSRNVPISGKIHVAV